MANNSSSIRLNNQSSLIISESGILEIGGATAGLVGNALNFDTVNKTEGTSLIIDGGQLLLHDGPSSNQSTLLNLQIGRINNPITAIEVRNGGVLDSTGVIRIDNSHPESVGIRLNNGVFNQNELDSIYAGWVRSGYSILSETGANTHNFDYMGLGGGTTLLYSKIGTPVYTNNEGANLTVNGYLRQMIMWGLNTETNANFGDISDFAVGEFQFSVSQVGKSRPIIHSINDSNYSFFFNNSILSNFRAIQSRSGTGSLPTMKFPESIEITPPVSVVSVGQKKQLLKTLTPDPSQLDNSTVFWSSSNSSIARVDDKGEVMGLNHGEAIITGQTINGLEATAIVRVEEFTFEFSGTEGNSSAVVTGYLGSNTNIEIPATAINHEAGWGSPSPVVGIGNNAFSSRGLTHVVIPDSIIEINDQAFYRNNLDSLIIPDTITKIGQLAFAENRLTDVTIGSGIKTIETQAFGFNLLTTIEIPNNIERIGTMAFHSNLLTNLMIPESVINIELRAFENNSLEKVTFLGELNAIGAQVFAMNPLKEILVEDSSVAHYQAQLSSVIMNRVTERTKLTVKEAQYSNDTQLVNNLMAREELLFSVVSKNRYQLVNLSSFLWEEVTPVVQWYKNDKVLAEETTQKFRIPEVEETDNGTYYAIVDGTQLQNISLEVSPLVQPDIPTINPEDGVLELENTNSTIEGLSLRYVSNLQFDATTFSLSNQILYANKNIEIPKVTVQDMRPVSQRNGWELQVRQSEVFMDGAQLSFTPFVHELNQDVLKVRAHSGELRLNTEAQRFAGTTTSEYPSGIVTMGMGDLDGQGVTLQVPGGAGIGNYEAELIWNLVASPDVDDE